MDFVYIILIVAALAYLFYFKPRTDKRNNDDIFDSRVLSVIDGLYVSGMAFKCTDSQMRSYARSQLERAHNLPSTQSLFEHKIATLGNAWRGSVIRSHIGRHGEHVTFALLCVIEYAKENNNQHLLTQCEQMLIEANSMERNYY